MPNIREYGSKREIQGGLTPSDRGVSALGAAASENSSTAGATAAAGRSMAADAALGGNAIAEGIGSLSKAVADLAETHYTKKEILQYGKDAAIFKAQKTAEWNETRNQADPNDPTVAARFNRENLQPALADFGKGFITKTGQSMAMGFRNEMADHFATMQESDQRNADKHAAELNLSTMNNANATSLHADPTGLPTTNKIVQDVINSYKRTAGLDEASNAHLDELGKDMQRTNTLAAARGMADTNPDELLKALDKGFGAEHLKEEDQATLRNYADMRKRQAIEAERADRTFKEHQDKEAADKVLVDLTKTLLKPDGTVSPNPKYIQGILDQYMSLPGAESATARAALGFGKSLQDDIDNKFLPKTDPATYDDFSTRAVLPPDDPKSLTRGEVFTAYTDRKLSQKEWATFDKQISDNARDPMKRDAYRQFNEWTTSMRPSIDRSVFGGQADAVGAQAFGQFKIEARAAFERAYEGGNWHDVITASNKPDFLGLLAKKWQTGTQEQMKRLQETMKTGIPILTAPVTRPQINLPEVDLKKPDPSLTPRTGPLQPPGPRPKAAVQSANKPLPGESPEAFLKRTGG